jgi:hypothetical protein
MEAYSLLVLPDDRECFRSIFTLAARRHTADFDMAGDVTPFGEEQKHLAVIKPKLWYVSKDYPLSFDRVVTWGPGRLA